MNHIRFRVGMIFLKVAERRTNYEGVFCLFCVYPLIVKELNMKTFIMIAALTLATGVAMANGGGQGGKIGKVETSLVFADDQTTPAGLAVDIPEDCTALLAADQSQFMIWCGAGEGEED
jgi:hypothetical protein